MKKYLFSTTLEFPQDTHRHTLTTDQMIDIFNSDAANAIIIQYFTIFRSERSQSENK